MLKEDRAGDPYHAWLQTLTEDKCKFHKWASFPTREVVYAKKSKSRGNPLPGGRRERIAARAEKSGKWGKKEEERGGEGAPVPKRPADAAPEGGEGEKRAKME